MVNETNLATWRQKMRLHLISHWPNSVERLIVLTFHLFSTVIFSVSIQESQSVFIFNCMPIYTNFSRKKYILAKYIEQKHSKFENFVEVK